MAKAYQVKQMRQIIVNYHLGLEHMTSKYEMIIYWSEQDQSYIVEIPELPGCMADGNSYQEAVRNAEQVINEWIETARELGRSIPEPKGRLLYA